jgi:DNA-binding NtrC family response regulator
MRALVVDDEDVIRDVVAQTLRADGWTVTEADSAQSAFDLMKQHQWPLVFCDVKLGAEGSPDGYAVLRRFGQEQPEALIILMTGHGSAAGALDAISFGAYDYLMKPWHRRGVDHLTFGPQCYREALTAGLRVTYRPTTFQT